APVIIFSYLYGAAMRRFVLIFFVILVTSAGANAWAEMPLQLMKRDRDTGVCTKAPENARDVFLHYPVIVEGYFNGDKSFAISKVYKGFRGWPIEFSPDGF